MAVNKVAASMLLAVGRKYLTLNFTMKKYRFFSDLKNTYAKSVTLFSRDLFLLSLVYHNINAYIIK